LDKAREDLKSFGASSGDLERMLGPKDEGFVVWPENWPVVEAFAVVQTQWSHSMSGPAGLDYTRVETGLRLAGVSDGSHRA
jgi:hypothetical protein